MSQITKRTPGKTTRRWLLGSAATAGGGLLLAACSGPGAATTEKVNTNPTTGGEVFWSIIGGQAALWVAGSWEIPGYRKNPDIKMMTQLNADKKTRTLMLQANNVVMFKDSKQRDLAWTTMRHMNKDTSDLAFQNGAGYVPVVLSNFDKPPFSTDPAWVTVLKQVKRSDSKPYPIVTNYQEMMNVIGEELVAAYKNQKIAKEALAETYRRAQELLDKEVAKRK